MPRFDASREHRRRPRLLDLHGNSHPDKSKAAPSVHPRTLTFKCGVTCLFPNNTTIPGPGIYSVTAGNGIVYQPGQAQDTRRLVTESCHHSHRTCRSPFGLSRAAQPSGRRCPGFSVHDHARDLSHFGMLVSGTMRGSQGTPVGAGGESERKMGLSMSMRVGPGCIQPCRRRSIESWWARRHVYNGEF